MADTNLSKLHNLVKYFGLVLVAAIVYVLLDFSIDIRPSQVQSSYRFSLGELPEDRVQILRRDNLSVLVIKRSAATIARLEQGSANLQDPDSLRSRQPGFAKNTLRSKHPDLFVSYALGTDLGCGLEAVKQELKEICSNARYDFAGRALQGNNGFQNLAIPDYNFTNNFSHLTIRP
jgi:hypothetical protein